jgi:hypothetical protein
MKSSNTVVSIGIIVAVVLASCGVGLLVHQARRGHPQPERGPDARDPSAQAAQSGPGSERTADTPEERAKRKEERAQILAKMNSLTDEQKEQFRNLVRQQFTAPSKRGFPRLSPEEQEQIQQKWDSMSEEERQAWKTRLEAELRAVRRQEGSPRMVPGASSGTEQGVQETGPEPNEAGRG